MSDARRYLLGEADEEAGTRLEAEYFGNEEASDRVADAEQDLIEDYLDGQLTAADRQRFERHYLASPRHRRRVQVVRQLRTIASGRQAGDGRVVARRLPNGWLAAAAALLIAAGAVWFVRARPEPSSPPAATLAPAPAPAAPTGPPETSPPAAPRILAMSLSPAGVRGAGESPSFTVPAATDLVVLRLEGDGGRESLADARVVVRTVDGEDIWKGRADAGAGLPGGVVAQAEIPADRLSSDDYVIVLFATDAAGERERYRYFVRVVTSSRPGA